ncbi:MAG: hypothetical protein KatS3mg002_0557 [Candidatus Woesearchaeota archaeon]|nr:MAG: hypothetical protein KatS3mg002_0557 [Candidatus Woesearchaeota archaeon]
MEKKEKNLTGRILKVETARGIDDVLYQLITLFVTGSGKEQIILKTNIPELYEGHKIIINYDASKNNLKVFDVDFKKHYMTGFMKNIKIYKKYENQSKHPKFN